jgi:hypothetical protein
MPTPRSISTLNRRSFFKSTAFGTAALAIPGFTLLGVVKPVSAQTRPSLNSGDIAVLKSGMALSGVDHRKDAYATHVWNVGIATLCRKSENTTQTRLAGPHTIAWK